MKNFLLLINIFSFYKAREIIRHFPLFCNNSYFNIFKYGILKKMAKVLRTNPGSSKHFFEIFPNFIWKSSLRFIIGINLDYENETR